MLRQLERHAGIQHKFVGRVGKNTPESDDRCELLGFLGVLDQPCCLVLYHLSEHGFVYIQTQPTL